MKLSQERYSTVAVNEDGETVFVSLRCQLLPFKESGKLPWYIEITYTFPTHLPQGQDALCIEQVDERLERAQEKDKLAINVASYLLPGRKVWIYYARNHRVFFERLNQTLEELPPLPLSFEIEEDPLWINYTEALQGLGLDPHFCSDETLLSADDAAQEA